jgi:hypothetical protein
MSRADAIRQLGDAAELLTSACARSGRIQVPSRPIDALDAGVAAIARIYGGAAKRRRRKS